MKEPIDALRAQNSSSHPFVILPFFLPAAFAPSSLRPESDRSWRDSSAETPKNRWRPD